MLSLNLHVYFLVRETVHINSEFPQPRINICVAMYLQNTHFLVYLYDQLDYIQSYLCVRFFK